jgi:hypothetical protein
MAVGFPAKTNFATGDVLTATNMNDVTGTLNLLQPVQYSAGKNILINGNFDIWQRGTTFASPSSTAYTADRWNNGGNAGGTITVSQQTTGVPIGSRYCLRTAAGGAGSYSNKAQIIETANTLPLWGKTVTFTAKLRRNASFTSTLSFVVRKSVTVDAGVASAWVDLATAIVIQNATLPTGTTSADWYTATFTATVPSDGTANSLQVIIGEATAQGSGAYWEVAQCQLEVSPIATAFATAGGGSIGSELALCQRYYYRAVIDAVGGRLGSGFVNSIIELNLTVPFPVPMRTKPSALEQTGTATDYQVLTTGNTITTCNTVPVISTSTQAMQGVVSLTTAGTLVAGQAGTMRVATANAYLGWSAEL